MLDIFAASVLAAVSAAHVVPVAEGLWMLDHEVTVAEFREFVKATGYVTDAENVGNALCFAPESIPWWDLCASTWSDAADDEPVRFVAPQDAEAFAQWAGGRLPTVEEWDAAVADAQPWNIWIGEFPSDPKNDPQPWPVHGRTPNRLGLHHMRGNVWEITSTRSGLGYVMRGGSYLCSEEFCAGWKPDSHDQSMVDPSEHIGFRVVWDVEE